MICGVWCRDAKRSRVPTLLACERLRMTLCLMQDWDSHANRGSCSKGAGELELGIMRCGDRSRN